jgi:hypothetical protein
LSPRGQLSFAGLLGVSAGWQAGEDNQGDCSQREEAVRGSLRVHGTLLIEVGLFVTDTNDTEAMRNLYNIGP